MKFPIQNKILLGFIVSVMALALIGWMSIRATTRLTATLDLVTHSQKVIAKVEAALAALASVENEQREHSPRHHGQVHVVHGRRGHAGGASPNQVGCEGSLCQRPRPATKTETDRLIKATGSIEKPFTVEQLVLAVRHVL